MPVSAAKWADRFRKFAESNAAAYRRSTKRLASGSRVMRSCSSDRGVMGPRAHPTLPFAAVHYLLLSRADPTTARCVLCEPDRCAVPVGSGVPGFPCIRRSRARTTCAAAHRTRNANERGRTLHVPVAGIRIRCEPMPQTFVDHRRRRIGRSEPAVRSICVRLRRRRARRRSVVCRTTSDRTSRQSGLDDAATGRSPGVRASIWTDHLDDVAATRGSRRASGRSTSNACAICARRSISRASHDRAS